jgi:hypothetical protein
MSAGGFDPDQQDPQPRPGSYGAGPHGEPGPPGRGPYGQGPYGQPPYYGQGPYGQPGQGPYGWQQPRRTNSLAIAALCCGIAQVIAGPLTGIPAIILGYVSMGQIRQTGEDGRGMAITGIVLGIAGLLLTVLVIIIFISIAHSISQNGQFQFQN